MGVATAIAIGGLAVTAATTANSFAQASEQKSKQRAAEADAQKAMDEARKKLDINYTDELAIKKEPYELQREAMLSQGAMAIQAGQESERGAAATAGKVQMAQNEAQAGIRTEMGKEATDIQNKQIQEQSRLRDLGVQLDLQQVEGAQMAARSAEEASNAHTAQAIQGVTSIAEQGLGMVNLYPKSSAKTPMGGTSGGDQGTQINSTAAKYNGSSFTPMDTALNPLWYNSKYTGANGVIPQSAPKFGGTFTTGAQSMFPQYDAFGNIIKTK